MFARYSIVLPRNISELGVREIARLTNLSSSTAGRLLIAMREKGHPPAEF